MKRLHVRWAVVIWWVGSVVVQSSFCVFEIPSLELEGGSEVANERVFDQKQCSEWDGIPNLMRYFDCDKNVGISADDSLELKSFLSERILHACDKQWSFEVVFSSPQLQWGRPARAHDVFCLRQRLSWLGSGVYLESFVRRSELMTMVNRAQEHYDRLCTSRDVFQRYLEESKRLMSRVIGCKQFGGVVWEGEPLPIDTAVVFEHLEHVILCKKELTAIERFLLYWSSTMGKAHAEEVFDA